MPGQPSKSLRELARRWLVGKHHLTGAPFNDLTREELGRPSRTRVWPQSRLTRTLWHFGRLWALLVTLLRGAPAQTFLEVWRLCRCSDLPENHAVILVVSGAAKG